MDTGAIRRSQATFSDIRDRLEAAVAGFDSVSGASVAQKDLRDRLDELGSSWGVGIKKLGTYAESAAEALSGVADAFESTDEELATALEERPAAPAQNGPTPA
ncbi:MAG: hypothetical protein DI566_11655 [Microbacterium sp.]|nr:MAG: hypothetical protein DI566_11655 [Microbacterium sp.]